MTSDEFHQILKDFVNGKITGREYRAAIKEWFKDKPPQKHEASTIDWTAQPPENDPYLTQD